MSAAFDAAFAFVIGQEGAYGDDPRDRGNWTGGVVGTGVCRGTKYGISAAAYPQLDIANVTLDQARAIYTANYWQPVHGDELPAPIGVCVFDAAVNQGVHLAVVILQRSVNVPDDGWIGPRTTTAASVLPVGQTFLEICARRALSYAADANFATYGLGYLRRLFRLSSQFAPKDLPS